MKINQNIVYAVLGVGILLFIYSLHHRTPHIDDAWIGEQVYWLNKSGVVKNVLMKNYSNNQEELLIYHKAFVYSGLLATKSFGFHLNVLQSLSLFYLLIFLGIFYFYMVKIKGILNLKQYAILLLLIFFEPHIFEYSFVFRPEILLLTVGFLSYIFLEYSISSNTNRFINVVITSLFTGLAILVHLNGLIFVIAAGLLLLFYGKYKSLIPFILINIGFVFLYFYHLGSFENVLLWFNQLTSYQTGKSSVGFSWDFVTNLLFKVFDEQRRFFHSPAEITTTILFFASIIFGFKNIKKSNPIILTYFVLLIVSLAILSPSKTPKYLIALFPYMIIIIVPVIKDLWKYSENKIIVIPKTKKSIFFFGIIVLFLIVSSIYNVKISSNKFNSNDYHKITQEFVKSEPNKTTILAPMQFIYDEIDNYEEIISLMSYNERAKTDKRLCGANFLKITQEEGIEYIFINDHYINKFALNEQITNGATEGYRVVGVEDGFTILELKHI